MLGGRPTGRRRVTATAGFALLALLAELTGRELTNRLDGALNVEPFATTTTRYYPFLLAGVRALAALVVAAAVWRVCRAHALAAAGLPTYALPVFAVCSILLALGWGAVRDWLADVEDYAAATFARASRRLR